MSDDVFKKMLFAVFVFWIVGTITVVGLGVYKQMRTGSDAIQRALEVQSYCRSIYAEQVDIDRCVATGYAPPKN